MMKFLLFTKKKLLSTRKVPGSGSELSFLWFVLQSYYFLLIRLKVAPVHSITSHSNISSFTKTLAFICLLHYFAFSQHWKLRLPPHFWPQTAVFCSFLLCLWNVPLFKCLFLSASLLRFGTRLRCHCDILVSLCGPFVFPGALKSRSPSAINAAEWCRTHVVIYVLLYNETSLLDQKNMNLHSAVCFYFLVSAAF